MYICISLNTNGIAEKGKRDTIFDFLEQCRADIILLQETHNDSKDNENLWTHEWGGIAIWSTGSNRSRGTAILFRPGLNPVLSNCLRDHEGRVIAVKAIINGTEINIMNIYAPNIPNERKDFFENLWHFKPGNENLILAGDFNCIDDLNFDKQGGNPLSGNIGITELKDFLENNSLKDTWRATNPGVRIYTWSNNDFTLRSRLDKWYITAKLHKTATSCIRACPHSDHSVVEITINLDNNNIRGKGVWKFNNELLNDRAFQREIRAFQMFWKDKKQDFSNIHEWWDEAKLQYKEIAVRQSVQKSRNRRKQEDSLIKKITDLKNAPYPDKNRIHLLEQQLKDIVDKRLDGIKIRSRAAWMEDSEKPTRYFFDLERKKQSAACISLLRTENKTVTTDTGILETAHAFYQGLYTEEPVDIGMQNKLLNQIDKHLFNTEKQNCEGPITRQEIDTSIKGMNMNKSPGPDGLTTEFYRSFLNELADDLVEIYNYAYLEGNLADSQTKSILRLLFKKGEREYLKKWRPIALLNTDYKILATTIANRLRPTLPQVIQDHQTCGIPGRTIFDTAMTLRDIVHDVNSRKTDGILISLDQEKAFDRVNRLFLDRVMGKMNYGPSLPRWIQTLYANASCKIINNGHLSEPVMLNRGVRQGCPLSPLLYVLNIEILLVSIRNNPRIHGINIPGNDKQKISAYADDATMTLKDDTSVIHAFETINDYERASGSKLNRTKTEGLYMGKQAGRTTGPVPITWKTDTLMILGGKFGNNEDQDWDKPVKKLEETLQRWQKRYLTIKGKTVLIKTYALATINYLASIFPLPDQATTRIHKTLFQFLWNNKNELISRATCHLPLRFGGLGIPDLKLVAKANMAKWLRFITDQEKDKTWVQYGRYWTGLALSLIKPEWTWLRSNLSPHGDPNNLPLWYKIMIKFAQQHRARITNAEKHQLTTRNFTEWQCEYEEPRCIAKWKRYVRPPLEMNIKWEYLWKSSANNRTKEFVWKLMHRVLPTKSYLASWGMRINTSCPYCASREDTHHALVGCFRAKQLWQKLQTLLEKIADSKIPILVETIALGNNLPTNDEAKALCFYVITLASSLLWKSRNHKMLHRDYQERDIYEQVIDKIQARIRKESIMNKSRLLYMWNYKDILCTYQNGTVQINIETLMS